MLVRIYELAYVLQWPSLTPLLYHGVSDVLTVGRVDCASWKRHARRCGHVSIQH